MRIDFRELLGKRVLVVGEVGSGKTRLLARFLEFLVDSGCGPEVTLIDLAPSYGGVGRLVEEHTDAVRAIRYLKPDKIFPPRLLGRNREEVLKYAELNYGAAEKLFGKFAENPSKILLINDLTIYLHRGGVEELLELIGLAETFAATAYEGSMLEDDKGSGITARERRLLSRLKREMDIVLRL